MALSTQPYKGARDFYPEDKRLQKHIFKKWRQVCEKFGYEEIDAPLLEPLELYLTKTSEEIINDQTYAFTDRGGRQIAIRPEMTPTVSRMVATRRQELAYPVRWYCIPNLWRYERPQRGRFREHWQLNVDIFGVEGIEADHEIIQVADALLQAFKAKREMYKIKLNSRKLINAITGEYLGLNEVQSATLIRLIDRKEKMEAAAFIVMVEEVFSPSQREDGAVTRLTELLSITEINNLPPELANHPSVAELKRLMQLMGDGGITNGVFDITLMRGFDYYTDIVFEVSDTHPDNNRSMFGGGRYDGLVGLFGVEPVPTVGFGMGDATFQNFLEVHSLMPKLHTETQLYVVLIGDNIYERSQKAISELRQMGVHVFVDSSGRKPVNQLKTAIKKGIPYVLFIGDKEIEEGRYTIKNLATEVEERHGLERIVSIVKDYRKK